MRCAKGLVAQYSAMEALPKLFVNGELTLGENIGDLTGVVISHRAYELSLAGKEAPAIDGTTGHERFFYGWVQAWRAKYRDDALRQQVYALCRRECVFLDSRFRNQVQAAAGGIAVNIAEGFGRTSHREFLQFLGYARASTARANRS